MGEGTVMVRVRFLGTGAGVLAGGRSQSILIVEDGERVLLIDAGQPLPRRLYEEGVDPRRVGGVLVTHAHPDHLMGLPGLLYELEALGVDRSPPIYVGESHYERVRALLENFKPRQLELDLRRFPDDREAELEVSGFSVETFPVKHSIPTVGARVVGGGECILFYSSDTIFLEELRERAECLVGAHEATLPEGMRGEGVYRGFHSTPGEALKVLQKSRYRVLVHISVYSFRDGYPRGDYIIGYDGLSISL